MRHVGNVNPGFPSVPVDPFQTNGIVKILGVNRVDGDVGMLAAIDSSGDVLGIDFSADGMGLAQDGFGKVQGEIVIAKHG